MGCSTHNYLYDEDLEFLGNISNEDLKILVDILCNNSNGDLQPCLKDKTYHQAWKCIASELQQLGGDTLMNGIRGGQGVKYRELLTDVCKKFKSKQDGSIDEIEEDLLKKFLDKYLHNKDASFIAELTNGMNISDKEAINKFLKEKTMDRITSIIAPRIITSLSIAIATQIVASRSLWSAFLVMIGARAPLAWLGPIGWIIGGILTIPAITGPAYRVTIPACLAVTALRRKFHDDLYDERNNIHAKR